MSLTTSSSSSFLFCILIRYAKIQTLDSSLNLLFMTRIYFCFLIDECYSYVALNIDNVKSITSVVKGQQPSWEEEFDL